MTAKLSKLKRMYWYMLATIVVLACFSTSPKAMDFKTIVASFSASEHALGVESKRHLRSSVSMTENVDSVTEDRGVIEILSRYIKVDKMHKSRVRKSFLRKRAFTAWAKHVEEKHEGSRLDAEIEKVKELIKHFGEKNVLLMIRNGQKDEKYRKLAQNLQNGFMMKWFMDGRLSEALKAYKPPTMMSFLEMPLWSAWIDSNKYANQPLYELVFHLAAARTNERELADLISKAKLLPDTETLATGLEEFQLNAWLDNRFGADNVFTRLGLYEAGPDAMKTSAWNTWVSYLIKVEQKQNPTTTKSRETLVLSALHTIMNDNFIQKVIAAGKADVGTHDFATQLEHEFQPTLLTLGNF